jgi:hypothetical protein
MPGPATKEPLLLPTPEFLVPQHCGFFIYAATRGDFVLGGLQAVFETELDSFLSELASLDLRCPLDPGCMRIDGACMACLHLGEPSCRYYNGYLNRQTLVGPGGYNTRHCPSIKRLVAAVSPAHPDRWGYRNRCGSYRAGSRNWWSESVDLCSSSVIDK